MPIYTKSDQLLWQITGQLLSCYQTYFSPLNQISHTAFSSFTLPKLGPFSLKVACKHAGAKADRPYLFVAKGSAS
ncbi:MAG: hypothetical protein DA405_10550 [Bacteroidetes bacterium]|nr:MAG: hypothetical protein DA405_10550 [Bacteroidota bacterium]